MSFVSTDIVFSEDVMAGFTGITPVAIHIPELGLNAPVQSDSFNEDGQLALPTSSDAAVWYTNSSKPGAIGNAVIAGHVDDLTGPAIFYDLHELVPGDDIIVEGTEGASYVFEVTAIESYPREAAPVSDIFGSSTEPNLNLITCNGLFNRTLKTHEERLVVYTTFIEELRE